MHLTKEQIQKTSRIKRLNIINSITGVKPANLIGSISENGHSNLAVFSSIVHLGSNPALWVLSYVHSTRLGGIPMITLCKRSITPLIISTLIM